MVTSTLETKPWGQSYYQSYGKIYALKDFVFQSKQARENNQINGNKL